MVAAKMKLTILRQLWIFISCFFELLGNLACKNLFLTL